MLAALLLAAIANVMAVPNVPDSGKVSPRPVEQRLELELNPAARIWSGSLLATLEFHGTSRRIDLRLAGPTVSRVEITDGLGRVDLSWGVAGDSVLTVETGRAIQPGRASLSVGFDGEWRAATPGIARDSAHTRARLARGSGIAFPAWPDSAAPTRWTLMVHAPRDYEVRASGRRTGIDEAPGWRTWTFRTAEPVPADSLRVSVRRPAAAAK